MGIMFDADDDSRLSTTSDVTFSIPAINFHGTAAVDVTLYSLNHDTGYWEFVNDVTQQGSDYEASTTNGVSYDRIYYMFGTDVTQTCFIKVRVYANDGFDSASQLSSAEITVVTSSATGANSASITRASTDRADSNGYCVSVPCEGATAVIYARLENEDLRPAAAGSSGLESALETTLGYSVNGNGLQLTLNSAATGSNPGPYYAWDLNWKSSSSCSDADVSDNHVRFYRESDAPLEVDVHSESPTGGLDECTNRLDYLLWDSVFSYYDDSYRYKTCFVKVRVPANQNYRVQVRSMVSDVNHPYFEQAYGVREESSEGGATALCLEARRPDKAGCSDTYFIDEDTTRVEIEVVSHSLTINRVNSGLTGSSHASSIISSTGSVFKMDFTSGNSYTRQYGIYCSESDDIDVAYSRARNNCKDSADYGADLRDDVDPDYWLVEFN